MNFEDLKNKVVDSEKIKLSFNDKLLATDIELRLKNLIRKEDLTSGDLREILMLLTSKELKLSKLDPHSRYVLGKYFAWTRELVQIGELYFEEINKIKQNNNLKDCEWCDEAVERTKRKIQHTIGFMIDIYLYLLRSTIGLKGYAFDTLSKSRFEYEYGDNLRKVSLGVDENKGKSFFNIK